MTDKEKAIVMAYTGICMLAGDKFQIFHKYVEDIMGRPVYTHEMATDAVDNEIKEKAKADFIALCKDADSGIDAIKALEQEPCEDVISRAEALKHSFPMFDDDGVGYIVVRADKIEQLPSVKPAEKVGQWIYDDDCREHGHCSECGYGSIDIVDGKPHNYCSNCGRKMEVQNEVSN